MIATRTYSPPSPRAGAPAVFPDAMKASMGRGERNRDGRTWGPASIPVTKVAAVEEPRWEQARANERVTGLGGYGAHFAQRSAQGAVSEGEARRAVALAPRGGRILD